MLDARLSGLLGQPRAAEFLRSVVAGGRFANAYLFHGPAGVGKMTAALAFASALLCEHGAAPDATAAPGLFDAATPPAPKPAAPDDDACGACAACVKTRVLGHPDLKFLFPVSGEERALDETVGEVLTAMREDPLYVFRYEKAASIRLSLTRDLLREMAFKPFEAARRVVVVRDADRMREDQYSAMLKAIEEPGASTVWVLTTSRLSRLPATIRSRCQKVRFAPIAEAQIREVLVERGGLRPAEATLLAALSSGSLARALELRDLDPAAIRDEALALIAPARRNDPAGLWAAAQKYMKFGKTGRDSLRRMVEFHQLWLRDLLRVRYGGEDAVLANPDLAPALRAEAQKVDAREIRRRLMVLEEMLRAIDGNVSADAAIFSGMARAAGLRLGEGEWPRHGTARWNY